MNTNFFARLLLISIFLITGIKSLFDINGFANMIASKTIPFPLIMAILVLALKIIASVMILLNFNTKLASTALIIFTIIATFLFHNVFVDSTQLNHMLKNTSIIGGLMLL